MVRGQLDQLKENCEIGNFTPAIKMMDFVFRNQSKRLQTKKDRERLKELYKRFNQLATELVMFSVEEFKEP
jgi:hypothetical protein